MTQQIGKILIFIGLLIVLAGILFYFFHPYLKWIGRLPGDIRVKKEHVSFYFPITTMLILSIGISLIVMLIKKFL